MSHTGFNHDNSQLFYEDASRGEFHNFGPIPAKTSPSEHQLYAAKVTAKPASRRGVGESTGLGINAKSSIARRAREVRLAQA